MKIQIFFGIFYLTKSLTPNLVGKLARVVERSYRFKKNLGNCYIFSCNTYHFNNKDIISVDNDIEPNKICSPDDITIIAFHGTTSFHDWKTNLDIRMKNIGNKSRVHGGLYKKYCQHRKNILTRIYKYVKNKNSKIYIIGHSSGGLPAMLLARDMVTDFRNISLITLGSPKLGNNAFYEEMNSINLESVHFVIDYDIVPIMPYLPSYKISYPRYVLEIDKKNSIIKNYFEKSHSINSYISLLEKIKNE